MDEESENPRILNQEQQEHMIFIYSVMGVFTKRLCETTDLPNPLGPVIFRMDKEDILSGFHKLHNEIEVMVKSVKEMSIDYFNVQTKLKRQNNLIQEIFKNDFLHQICLDLNIKFENNEDNLNLSQYKGIFRDILEKLQNEKEQKLKMRSQQHDFENSLCSILGVDMPKSTNPGISNADLIRKVEEMIKELQNEKKMNAELIEELWNNHNNIKKEDTEPQNDFSQQIGNQFSKLAIKNESSNDALLINQYTETSDATLRKLQRAKEQKIAMYSQQQVFVNHLYAALGIDIPSYPNPDGLNICVIKKVEKKFKEVRDELKFNTNITKELLKICGNVKKPDIEAQSILLQRICTELDIKSESHKGKLPFSQYRGIFSNILQKLQSEKEQKLIIRSRQQEFKNLYATFGIDVTNYPNSDVLNIDLVSKVEKRFGELRSEIEKNAKIMEELSTFCDNVKQQDIETQSRLLHRICTELDITSESHNSKLPLSQYKVIFSNILKKVQSEKNQKLSILTREQDFKNLYAAFGIDVTNYPNSDVLNMDLVSEFEKRFDELRNEIKRNAKTIDELSVICDNIKKEDIEMQKNLLQQICLELNIKLESSNDTFSLSQYEGLFKRILKMLQSEKEHKMILYDQLRGIEDKFFEMLGKNLPKCQSPDILKIEDIRKLAIRLGALQNEVIYKIKKINYFKTVEKTSSEQQSVRKYELGMFNSYSLDRPDSSRREVKTPERQNWDHAKCTAEHHQKLETELVNESTDIPDNLKVKHDESQKNPLQQICSELNIKLESNDDDKIRLGKNKGTRKMLPSDKNQTKRSPGRARSLQNRNPFNWHWKPKKPATGEELPIQTVEKGFNYESANYQPFYFH